MDNISIGDGFTFCIGGDAYPYTVVAVLAKNKILVTMDTISKNDDGNIKFIPTELKMLDGSPINTTKLIKKRGSSNSWLQVGAKHIYTHGERHYERDPHF